MAEILIIDDNPMLCEMLSSHLARANHFVKIAHTLREALHLAQQGNFDVLFLDVQMPDGNGLESIQGFADTPSKPEIIIMTGSGDPDGAKKAIQSGAWSYLEKPHVLKNLLLPLTRALEYREEKKKIELVPMALKRDAIIGCSLLINNCLDQVAKAATGEANVLITGETGTGKEVFARAIHDNSNRTTQPFVVVDCASLPENLIESTLFGHLKGTFTGADRSTIGLIKMAHGGTLFLDEVGELPERIQKTFLRVLQEHSFRPIGATKEDQSNFRLIAATNRDLAQKAADGTFRPDLLYRLRSLSLHLPPLRDRKEDIRPLCRYFLARLCDRAKISTKGISDDFFDSLIAYDWPGNVRELQQTLEQVFANAIHHPTIFAFHLPERIRVCKALKGFTNGPAQNPTPSPAPPIDRGRPTDWKSYRAEQERYYLQHLLAFTQGNIKEACQISGLSRARLYQLINLYNLSPCQDPAA
ncbi:MAG: sigma-54-dependent transcriptional regulator [Desulfobulbus sp.]